jgi:hypothetical protein
MLENVLYAKDDLGHEMGAFLAFFFWAPSSAVFPRISVPNLNIASIICLYLLSEDPFRHRAF